MSTYFAFLRGINVGGNAIISMKDLAALCETVGLKDVRTYINSGNVICTSNLKEEKIEAILEKALAKKMGKEVKVAIRNEKEIAAIVKKNPFPKGNPSQVAVLLMKKLLQKKLEKEFVVFGNEEVKMGKREVYIHYADGMGRSKLKYPKSLGGGTVRNINTLTKLAEMAKE